MTPVLDAVLPFEQEIILRIFSFYSEETEEKRGNWRLHTLDADNVLVVSLRWKVFLYLVRSGE